jgi:hypothetical protein
MNIESLEGRQLLSASAMGRPATPGAPGIKAVQDGGTLTLANVATVQVIEEANGTVTVYDRSRSGADPNFARTFQNITDLFITGTSRDDDISVDIFNVNTTIDAGGGSDFLTVSVGDDVSDSPQGTANVLLNGQAGDDVFGGNNYGTGTFVFNGGRGLDSLNQVYPVVGYNVVFNQ